MNKGEFAVIKFILWYLYNFDKKKNVHDTAKGNYE